MTSVLRFYLQFDMIGGRNYGRSSSILLFGGLKRLFQRTGKIKEELCLKVEYRGINDDLKGKTLLSKKTLKLALTSTLVTTLMVGVGLGVDLMQEKEFTLDVDGVVTTIKTDAETIQAALAPLDVELGKNAVVAPSLDKAIHDGSAVVVRYMKPVTVVADGVTHSQKVLAVDVNEALAATNISVGADAYMSHELDETLPIEGAEIVVSNPKKVELVTEGEKTTVETNAPLVADVLDENGIEVDADDELSTELDEYVRKGMSISYVEIDVDTEDKQIKKDLRIKYVEDPTLDEGKTKVRKRGVAPVVERTVRTTYADGAVRDREVLRETVVSRGVPRVVVKGTKPVGPSDTAPGGGCSGWQPFLNKYFGGQANTACRVMLCESGGNPRAQNPVSSASGLFQFIDGSWRSARTAVGGEKYARAYQAPAEMQIEAAAKWLERTSWSQWECY